MCENTLQAVLFCLLITEHDALLGGNGCYTEQRSGREVGEIRALAICRMFLVFLSSMGELLPTSGTHTLEIYYN